MKARQTHKNAAQSDESSRPDQNPTDVIRGRQIEGERP